MATTQADYAGPIKPEPAIAQLGDPILHEITRLYPFDLGEDGVGSDDFEDLIAGAHLTNAGDLEWAIDETGRILQYDGVGSSAYAHSTDPPVTHILGANFTILWSGIIPSGLGTITWALASLGSTTTGRHFAYLKYQNAAGTNEVQFEVRSFAVGNITIKLQTNDRRIVVIGVHDTDAGEYRLHVDGTRVVSGLPAYSAQAAMNRLHLNALHSGPDVVNESQASASIMALWERSLTDDEALRLTMNPMLLIERDPTEDLLDAPFYRQLTAPAFPMVSTKGRPVAQTDPRKIGVLIATKANRKEERVFSIRLLGLNGDERSLLEDLFDQGRGMVEAFWVNIPNEAAARRMVIKGPILSLVDRSAVDAEASIELVDVTDPLDF